MKKRLTLGHFVILAVVLALLVAACTPAAAPTPTTTAKPAAATPTTKPAAVVITPTAAPAKPTPEPAKLKVGSLGVLADAGNFVAFKKGYFKEQGIDVEFITFDSGAKQIAPLGTGELDAGRGAISAGLFNAIQRGIPLKIVAESASISTPPVKAYEGIMIRKDLIDAGVVKDYKDLKGKKIAVPAQGINTEAEVAKALELGGLAYGEADIQYMGMPDMITALAGKSIDGAIIAEPFVTAAVERGLAVRWKGVEEVYPGHLVSILMYSPAFIQNKPEVAKRFGVAYLKGIRDYYDAFFKDKDKKTVVSILTEMTNVKDAALYDKTAPQYVNPDGYVNAKSVAEDQDFFLATGQITQKIDLSKAIDNQYMDYAVQTLGKYR